MTHKPQDSRAELAKNILTEFKQVRKLAPADYTENCTNTVMSMVDAYVAERVEEAEDRGFGKGAAIYEKELQSQKRIVNSFVKREELKVEPMPIRVEVNPKSHTVLTNQQPDRKGVT